MSVTTDILPLIPQRPPFVMVHTLEACDDQGAVSSFTVLPDNIFVEDGLLREPALVENIAQTGAARIGYLCLKENRPVPVGFIGSVQNLKINSLPKTGEVLETSIVIKNQIFNATIIEGEIKSGDALVAHCEMRIFIANT